MAAFKRPKILKDIIVRRRLNNPLPNSGFKISLSTRRLLCMQITVLWAPLQVVPTKYWAMRLALHNLKNVCWLLRRKLQKFYIK